MNFNTAFINNIKVIIALLQLSFVLFFQTTIAQIESKAQNNHVSTLTGSIISVIPKPVKGAIEVVETIADPFYDNLVANLKTLKNNFTIVNPRSNIVYMNTNLKPIDGFEAKRLSRYAGLSYCEDQSLYTWSNCLHCEAVGDVTLYGVYNDKKVEAKAVIVIDDSRKQIILSFRGTSKLVNWLYNVNFKLVSLDQARPDIKVHSGFKQLTDRLLPLYLDKLGLLMRLKPTYSLIITGHSLGGAIAMISTVRLKKILNIAPHKLVTITYGSPRIGNLPFAAYYNNMDHYSLRVTNKADLVTHLLPRSFNYIHSDVEFWINEPNTYLCSGEVAEDPMCTESTEPFLSVNDHLFYWGVRLGACK